MDNSEKNALDTIEGLYQSVLDESAFDPAIARLGSLAGSVNGFLSSWHGDWGDAPVATSMFSSDMGNYLDMLSDYQAHYYPYDVTLTAWDSLKVGDWFMETRARSNFERQRDPILQELMQSHDLGSWVTLKLKGSMGLCAFSLNFEKGREGPHDTELARVARVVPHLRQVLQLRHHHAELRQLAAAGLGALNLLLFPLWIVSAQGHIRFVNRAAEKTLLMTSFGQRLCPHTAAAKAELARLLLQACAKHNPSGGALNVTDWQGRAHAVQVLPLPPHLAVAEDCAQPLALVLMPANTQAGIGLSGVLSALYAFTPAEVRIAAALLIDQTAEEMAVRFEVKASTVRMQLKSMLAKAGCRRQAELVRLLAGLAVV